ncbi:CHAT domain-containing protein [Pelobium manganitolerans]|uniref:CHAT domain-containing protein n=1 Tax=Pelobium manganitolerans TaxID=1842495 RepID=UPI003FA3C120
MLRILTVLFCLCFAQGFAQNVFEEKQNALKAKDSLAKWIDNRVNYALEEPNQRLDFLMQTNGQIWRKPKSAQEKEAWLFLLLNQGYYQLQSGDILASIKAYEDAYAYFQKHRINVDVEEYILKPLSNNYTRLGDYERAIYIQKRSLTLALKNQDKDLAASAYGNLSTSYRSKNDFVNAQRSAVAGLKIANPKSDVYGLLLSNLADIANEQKAYAVAQTNIGLAIRHLQQQKPNASVNYWLSGAYTLAGDIAFNQLQFGAANNYYKLAEVIIKQKLTGKRKRELTYIYCKQGDLSLKQKNYKQAIAFYNKALKVLLPAFSEDNLSALPDKKQLFAENKLQAALSGKATALEALAFADESLQASILAFEVSEKLREEFTYKRSKEQLQAESKTLAEELINKAFALWQKTKKPYYANLILLFTEKTKSRILYDELQAQQQSQFGNQKLQAQYQKLKQSLAYYQKQAQEQESKNFQKQIADVQFQLSNIQKQMNFKNPSVADDVLPLLKKVPAGKQAVIFFSGPKNSYLIVADQKLVREIKFLGETAKLDSIVLNYLKTYFYEGPMEMANHPRAFVKSSYHLYQALQLPQQRQSDFLVVKDGMLNFLPFESLITEANVVAKVAEWPYLLRRADLSYAFSLNSLNGDYQKTLKKLSAFFLSETGSAKEEIAAVKSEYQKLKNAFSGDFYLNHHATTSAFTSALKQADILHISSHAYLTLKQQEPVLELFRSRFYLLELADKAKVPPLVVLSACQTADGAYIAGEGVLSFSRGFVAAGAKGIISSLWNVNDQAGADLMLSYYQNLEKNGGTQGVMRQTKLAWLQTAHTNQMLLLPYYWDSLIYSGANLQVELHQPFPWLYLVLGVLFLIGITALLYYQKRLHISPTGSQNIR